jgi:hypothetical protein
MSFFNRREDPCPPEADHPARPEEGLPEPRESVQDEMGLPRPGPDEEQDPLRIRDLSSKPDDDLNVAPGHFHREVL